jgi:hypothetical protein
MHFYSIRNLSHDPALANALGDMVVAWAHAELMMFRTLARITGTGLNMAMAGYFCIPTFEARVKFTIALIPEWETADYDKGAIKKAIEKLAKLASTRNHRRYPISEESRSVAAKDACFYPLRRFSPRCWWSMFPLAIVQKIGLGSNRSKSRHKLAGRAVCAACRAAGRRIPAGGCRSSFDHLLTATAGAAASSGPTRR